MGDRGVLQAECGHGRRGSNDGGTWPGDEGGEGDGRRAEDVPGQRVGLGKGLGTVGRYRHGMQEEWKGGVRWEMGASRGDRWQGWGGWE